MDEGSGNSERAMMPSLLKPTSTSTSLSSTESTVPRKAPPRARGSEPDADSRSAQQPPPRLTTARDVAGQHRHIGLNGHHADARTRGVKLAITHPAAFGKHQQCAAPLEHVERPRQATEIRHPASNGNRIEVPNRHVEAGGAEQL